MHPISREQREIMFRIYEADARSREINDLPSLPSYRQWRKTHCGRHGLFCVISPILTYGQKRASSRQNDQAQPPRAASAGLQDGEQT